MINHQLLIDTAALYSRRAKNDTVYAYPSEVLNNVVKELELNEAPSPTEISNSDQFIAIRKGDTAGGSEIIRHPLDFVEKGLAAGVEALKSQGMLNASHNCLIAVPRGSLTGTFTLIYEVVRRCGWSVLPLGGSTDSQDISYLCNKYQVDTLIIAADALDLVFTPNMIGQFDSIRNLLYVSGAPSQKTLDTIKSGFPQLEIKPFLYQSDIIGPIGLPKQGGENDSFDILENILVEVESEEGEISLNGSGRLLISVLGLEQPTLIRRDIGDFGVLTSSDKGQQIVRLLERNPQ